MKPIRQEDLGDFEGVTGQDQRPARGGQRGGFRGGERGQRGSGRGGFRGGRGERREGEEGAPRGGRGGFRGGRGGRGERREGEEGEPREFGESRGRGGRGRGRGVFRGGEATETVEGEENVAVARKERHEFSGKTEHFEGKRGEKWHPYDRRSGTGRGRGVAREGHGKGNLGTTEDLVKRGEDVEGGSSPVVKIEAEGEETTAQQTEKVEEEVEQTRDEKPVEREEEPEEETKGLTLQEYLAQKKKATIKKEARKPEESKKANLEKVERTGDRTETKQNSLKNQELYSAGTAKTENVQLLGFQGGDDDFYPRENRESKRGGRGGFRGGRGGARP